MAMKSHLRSRGRLRCAAKRVAPRGTEFPIVDPDVFVKPPLLRMRHLIASVRNTACRFPARAPAVGYLNQAENGSPLSWQFHRVPGLRQLPSGPVA